MPKVSKRLLPMKHDKREQTTYQIRRLGKLYSLTPFCGKVAADLHKLLVIDLPHYPRSKSPRKMLATPYRWSTYRRSMDDEICFLPGDLKLIIGYLDSKNLKWEPQGFDLPHNQVGITLCVIPNSADLPSLIARYVFEPNGKIKTDFNPVILEWTNAAALRLHKRLLESSAERIPYERNHDDWSQLYKEDIRITNHRGITRYVLNDANHRIYIPNILEWLNKSGIYGMIAAHPPILAFIRHRDLLSLTTEDRRVLQLLISARNFDHMRCKSCFLRDYNLHVASKASAHPSLSQMIVRRVKIWQDRTHNEQIAELARYCAARIEPANKPTLHGLVRMMNPASVSILVECREHAETLQQWLPDWTIRDVNSRPDEDQMCSIITAGYARQTQLRSTMIIRLDHGTIPMDDLSFCNERVKQSIFDYRWFQTNLKQSKQEYAQAGWDGIGTTREDWPVMSRTSEESLPVGESWLAMATTSYTPDPVEVDDENNDETDPLL
jgi:hypothetical protein